MLAILSLLAALAPLAVAAPTAIEGRAFVPPQASLVSVHPKGHSHKCLDVKGGVHNMGEVVIKTCNSSPSQQWYVYVAAPTYIMSASNTALCVDAGTNPLRGYFPSNGAYAKLMLCPSDNWPSPYDSPAGTKWTYINGAQFQQKGTGFCLDNADGSVKNGNKVQIWDCHDSSHQDYDNQVWEFTYL